MVTKRHPTDTNVLSGFVPGGGVPSTKAICSEMSRAIWSSTSGFGAAALVVSIFALMSSPVSLLSPCVRPAAAKPPAAVPAVVVGSAEGEA